MSEHEHHTDARAYDVAVVGGSAAGLAAALQLGRQRRSVIVLDSGQPRNAPAANMHGYLGHDGLPPGELLEIARAEVRGYGVEVLTRRVVEVTRTGDDRFAVDLDDGHRVVARRVLVATGLVDELPAIDGLDERWGEEVIHCPFCHGFEVRDKRLVQIVTHPMGLHPAGLFRQLTGRLTVVLHEGVGPDDPELEPLRRAGVAVVEGRVSRVVTAADGRVEAVELADGTRLGADVVAVGPRFRPRVEAFASVGLVAEPHPSGLGEALETSSTGQTSVTGIYAAGNVTDPSHQVLHAAADGSRAGAMISFSLVAEDLAESSVRSSPASEWDERYRDGRTWSGDPNSALVTEVSKLAVGRALDVGAGEGGDAIWLAEQGWDVTASDVSAVALERVAGFAGDRGVKVRGLVADVESLAPFGDDTFDLVTAHYLPIRRSPDNRAVHNLAGAVDAGGALLVVGHSVASMREHALADPEAFVQPGDIAAVLSAMPEWHIDVLETRPRGGEPTSPHVDDTVLLARRRASS